MAELADAPDLGSGISDVQVQVLLPAPKMHSPYFGLCYFFIKGMIMKKVIHNISPVYDNNSKILILGSFPSVKSREAQFFYGHPRNRFWQVLSEILCEETPISVKDKKAFLLNNHIAVWDVIASCDIEGSSDSSIKNVKANDISLILGSAEIKAVFCNGATSFKFYQKYLEKGVDREAIKLPSTSPANAAFNMDKLINEWKIVLDYLS